MTSGPTWNESHVLIPAHEVRIGDLIACTDKTGRNFDDAVIKIDADGKHRRAFTTVSGHHCAMSNAPVYIVKR